MYNFQVADRLQKILKKLAKKDSLLHERVLKKMKEVVNSFEIEHYKNLQYNLKDSKRTHVGHFILVFRFEKENDLVIFDDFDHHDKIYGN